MDYLGLFCLGSFIGALVTYGLQFVNGLENWQQLLATIIAAVFTGAVITFVDRFKNSPALGAYAIGLLVALLWAYAKTGVDNIKSVEQALQWLGWLHIGGSTLISIAAAALFLPPAFRETWKK
jgi:Kef-type K+ transport system membrane component KefB